MPSDCCRRKYLLVVLLFVLIGSNLATYFIFAYRPAQQPENPPEEQPALSPEFSAFVEVLELLSRKHIEQPGLEQLMRGAIEGMVEAVGDPQTTFLDRESLENFLLETSGSYSGIGVRIIEVEGAIVVFDVFPGSPAEKGGLVPGDCLLQADGAELTGQGLDRAVELLRGPRGTAVEVTVQRPGAAETHCCMLQRDDIKIESVSSRQLEPGLGYIHIASFDSSTGADFAAHLQRLEDEGLDQGLILDLRNNAGGLLDEAIKVGRLLVPAGEIVRVVDGRGNVQETYTSTATKKPYPLAVIVNEDTASASEIVAGALRDRGAAFLVGTRTYGKGTVQAIEPLSGGNALRMTVSRYLIPSGRDLHGEGLEADYVVDIPEAFKYYRYYLPGRLEKGSYGPGVQLLQQMLTELGFTVEANGIFDEATAAALAAFQQYRGLSVTGVFDDQTWVKLRQALDELFPQRDIQLQETVRLLKSGVKPGGVE